MDAQSNREEHFTIGVNYWPRHKGLQWWGLFDRGEVAEDFARIRAMGLQAVRIFPLWGDLQPEIDRLDHQALDHFGIVLDLAADSGLQVLPVLFGGWLFGTLWLPGWMVTENAEAGRRLIVSGRDLRHAAPKNFYGNRALNQAQFLLIRETVGYFGKHPSLWGWELGQRTAEWDDPPSPAAAQDWLMSLAEVVHQVAPGAPLAYTCGEPGLTGPLYIQHIAEAIQVLGWMADPGGSALAEHPLDVDIYRLGIALLRGLAGRRTQIMLSAVGVATVPPGQPGHMLEGRPEMRHGRYAASEAEQAEFVGAVLQAAWQERAAAVWLSSFSDYPERLWSAPPLDLALRARTSGLTRADGSDKPVVAVVRNLAERIAHGDIDRSHGPVRKLTLDPDAYYGARDERGASAVAGSLAAAVRRWRDGGD